MGQLGFFDLNRRYESLTEIPHLDQLMASSPEAALDGAEIIVIGHIGPHEVATIAAAHNGRSIIDLQGIESFQMLGNRKSTGICW